MGRRNPIYVIGEPIRKGVTWLSDDLIRAGAHDDALGSDGFVVMAYLLSCATVPGAGRLWETSAAEISEKYGWGRNRERASKALERAVKDDRLILREYLRDGALVARRRAYVVCAGGRQFTDEERLVCSAPIVLESKSGAA
ncbi:hypothetical protein NWT09_13130 [Mycolicibacterium sp. jd]|uniref:hypothetical protein n=1 Tax=unclassified Mycolicibacterium TaxID=2636767 RepID=UPI00351B0C1E